VKEAIGDRFHAVLVDNGVMRMNECQQVKDTLSKHLGINLTVADASEKFLSRLSGVVEPEKKRKIIGGTFIDIFEEEAVKIEKAAENTPSAGKVEWFLQGTLYPVRTFAPRPSVIEQHAYTGFAGRHRVDLIQGAVGDDQGLSFGHNNHHKLSTDGTYYRRTTTSVGCRSE